MQLSDETIEFCYQGVLQPRPDGWTPLAELQSRHLLPPARLKAIAPQLQQVRSQVATERDLPNPAPELRPLEPGFIDLPQKLLDAHRRQGAASELGRVLALGQRLREQTDRVVIVGGGGPSLASRAMFQALRSAYHNELPDKARLGVPRIYFEGDGCDPDSFQDLLDLFEHTCVDSEIREERWGAVTVSKSGTTLETAAAYRLLRREGARLYGNRSERLATLFLPVTGKDGRFRDLVRAEGVADQDVLGMPENIGSRFAVMTAAGLLPAAVMGLDVRALLLGAAAMTKRFFEEPFERNPVLQFAAVNHLVAEDLGKTTRITAAWSRKLEGLARWYDHLLSESLGKLGRGPTPVSAVMPRDLATRGQQHQDGPRDKMVNNIVVKSVKATPATLGMADRNEDDLNQFSRRTLADLQRAALEGASAGFSETARPSADLVLPSISEVMLGQLFQMLMLATVVEGRLMGVNPYGQPGREVIAEHTRTVLKAMPVQVG